MNTSINIYKVARETAGLTVEQAAERLGVEPRTVYNYEAGKTIPCKETIVAMAGIYNACWLLKHVCKGCPIGAAMRTKRKTA